VWGSYDDVKELVALPPSCVGFNGPSTGDNMNCLHTGLDTRMCGHCNGSRPLVADEFNGSRNQDEEPRLRKGRDSAQWVGIGRSLGESGPATKTYTAPRSAWGKAQLFRSLVDMLDELPKNLPIVPPLPTVACVVDGRNIDCDTRLSPPRKTTAAVPKVYRYEKMPHARSRKQTAARIVARNRS
jgi:hypothetical protein